MKIKAPLFALLIIQCFTACMSPDSNRLIDEKSPYLLQHAYNLVDWYPWGEEAFEKARKENKPIFLSIGYSTCHWCHVMERESFENEDIAAYMNEHFVNIKVDREERPDVDDVYMTFVQATTGHGGWPMSVWLTPDLKPFFGGTYFPPADHYGRPGFPSILERIHKLWSTEHERISKDASQIVEKLKTATTHEPSDLPSVDIAKTSLTELTQNFDPTYGGFGGAPKFPRPVTLNLLFGIDALSEDAGKAREMALFTLSKMAKGGMHDQVGYGFHRYSVDEFWHIPHYEKMLYDQAQLLSSYADAYALTREASFRETGLQIIDYLDRKLSHPEGGYYSAEDADSLPSPESDHKSEGAFYIWTKKEIAEHLSGKDLEIFSERFDIREEGNTPSGSDPHGELTGTNTLIVRAPIGELSKKYSMSESAVMESLEKSRQILYSEREKRPKPHLDDKIITAWNGLMISGLARSSRLLEYPQALEGATRAADFIRKNLYDSEKKRLLRTWREGPADIPGFAEDYAFMIRGLIDLYEASGDIDWLQWAVQLQNTQDSIFWDPEDGGYYSAGVNDPSVLIRIKEEYDGAEPSPNSVAADNLLRLGALLHHSDYSKKAEQIFRTFGDRLTSSPVVAPELALTFLKSRIPAQQVVLAGSPDSPGYQEMLKVLNSTPHPHRVLVFADDGKSQEFFSSQDKLFAAFKPIEGKSTVYVCENFTCKQPTTDAQELLSQLQP